MDIEEGDVERLSKLAQLVEGNCEFLTTIRQGFTQRSDLQRRSLRTLEDYLGQPRDRERKSKLNIDGLLQLLIELAYFLYSCRNFAVTPNIASDDLRVEETFSRSNDRRFSIVLYYRLTEQRMQDSEAALLFNTFFEDILRSLEEYLRAREEFTQNDIENEQTLELFRRQYRLITQELDFFSNREPIFFQCLEQTALFYEQSMLYRIKNCSMLDFIKTDEKRLALFKQAKSRDEGLVIEYNKEKKLNKGEHEGLRNKEREIDNNLNEFFRAINERFMEEPNRNERDQTYRVKFNYRIKEREKYAYEEVYQSMLGANIFRKESRRLMDCKRPQADLEYYIEYSSERNSICVKLYMPSINVNVETSDFLMFQSNVLTFEAVNVSIELSEPRQRAPEDRTPPKKVVTFKGTSSFNMKEPPLEKILLLMDITMISSRIYEPELNPNRYGQGGKEYQRLATISKKINHYTKLFMKCARKVYSE